MACWPDERPEPVVDWPSALRDEALKYRNCGFSGIFSLAVRWLTMHLRPLPLGWPQPDPQRAVPLIVTLTTIPDRLKGIRATLNSLILQTERPDAIVLWLPKVCRRGGPYKLPSNLQQTEAIKVLRSSTDWGPATKLLPSLRHFAGQPVRFLVVDDDNIYPPNFVETFLRWSEHYPKAALGYRGHLVNHPVNWSTMGTLYGTHRQAPALVDIVTGTWGILIPGGLLGEEVFDYESYPPEAFYVDDIWFNGHLAKAGVERILIPASHPPVSTAGAYQRALGVEHNADGRHNETLLAFFEDYWSSSRE